MSQGTKQQTRAGSQNGPFDLLMPVLFSVGFVLSLGFLLVFGFLFDRASNVPARENETLFGTSGRLLSTVFHAGLCFFLLYTFGPVGFVYLPMVVLVVARRRSAFKGKPYSKKDLMSHVFRVLQGSGAGEATGSTEVRNAKILRRTVLVTMVVTALIGILALFKLPVTEFVHWAGGITWGLWVFIAWKAAAFNITAAAELAKTREWAIKVLRQLFNGSAADWEDVVVTQKNDTIVVTNTPLFVATRGEDADAILAQIAEGWELGQCTPDRVVLERATSDTIARRAQVARSGGLVVRRTESRATQEPAPAATVQFTEADFL